MQTNTPTKVTTNTVLTGCIYNGLKKKNARRFSKTPL